MVLSSRDRITVSVEDRLALSAERRRLRFSFQINDVKDPTGLPAPPFYARWRRGAAYLVAAVFSVNRLPKTLPTARWPGSFRAQKSPWAAEGLPSSVRNESVEAGETIRGHSKLQESLHSFALQNWPAPKRGAAYIPPFPPAQPLRRNSRARRREKPAPP